MLKAKKFDCAVSLKKKKKLSSTGNPTTHSYTVRKEFQTYKRLADKLDKKSSTSLHTSQVFHLQMKITLTIHVLCLSIKM